jgi:subtilisin family serine protease
MLELREQVDLGQLVLSIDRLGLPRSRSRREALDALTRISQRGVDQIAPELEALYREGLIEYWKPIRFRNRIFVTARAAALDRLRGIELVARLIPEYDGVREAREKKKQSGSAGSGVAAEPAQAGWAIDALGLRELWANGVNGEGVLVGILDTGLLGDHEAFRTNRSPGMSWFDPTTGTPEPVDTRPYHGTAVLGCAVGASVDGAALGAAPGARWAAALSNVENSYNNMNMSLAADWLMFEARPDVVLAAWGHGVSSCDPRDREMIEAFAATGALFVSAAGNDGPAEGSAQAPAALEYEALAAPIVTGAVDRFENVHEMSSRGPSRCAAARLVPDVVAPGVDILVPAPPSPVGRATVSGTSFSVGWVGGVAALILQVNPELQPWQVAALLRDTAKDLGVAGPDNVAGSGLIQPSRAVRASRLLVRAQEKNGDGQ